MPASTTDGISLARMVYSPDSTALRPSLERIPVPMPTEAPAFPFQPFTEADSLKSSIRELQADLLEVRAELAGLRAVMEEIRWVFSPLSPYRLKMQPVHPEERPLGAVK